MFAKFFASFRRITNAQRVAIQIAEIEKAVLENQATADHYQALADGGNRTLARLRALQVAQTPARIVMAPVPRKRLSADAKASIDAALSGSDAKAAAKTLRRVG